MAFEVFDLAKVYQNAEAIKGMRRQGEDDIIKRQFMQSQIANAQQSGQIAGSQERRAQQAHDMQIDAVTAKQRYIQAGYIQNAEDPISAARDFAPEFVQMFEEKHGPGTFEQLPPDQVKALAKHAQSAFAAKAGIGPEKPIEVSPGNTLIDPNTRQPIYTNPKTTNTPTSWDEFALSQKDPEFAAFLKSKRGKGLSVTMPDGTSISLGDVPSVGPGGLTAPTRNKLQESIVGATDELERLNSIGEAFDPKFLQAPGKLKAGAFKLKDFAGGYLGDLTPDQQKYLGDYSAFGAEASKNLSAILNRLSGAAISPAESERLKKGIPNDNDSPTQFQAKYKAAVKDSTRAIMRANWALTNGIGSKSVDELAKLMPLNGIDQVYEQRANQIWQELGGAPTARQQAIAQANKEFGVAR